MLEVNSTQATQILTAYVKAGIPALLVGAAGVGKSSIVEDVAKNLGYDMILSHPVVSDPTDAKGLPFPSPDGKSATFLPFGDLERALSATRPTIWFLDDLGQAAPAVQASFMQLLLARQIGEHKLPSCVTFVAATNRRQDRAGVSGILDPVLSRFGTILQVGVSAEDWAGWAMSSGRIRPEVIAFIRFRPELIHAPLDKKSKDMENFPCPRTWEMASKAISLGLPTDLETIALQGAVGQGAAVELAAFLKMHRSKLPSIQGIMDDPENAQLNYGPDVMWAVVSALARKADAGNCGGVFRYAERLHEAGWGEFALLLVQDVRALNKARKEKGDPSFFDVEGSRHWAKLMLGPIGKIQLL